MRAALIVSIRAPRSSAGRQNATDDEYRVIAVSIRAPRSSAGRRSFSSVSRASLCFNPRPAFFCGATGRGGARGTESEVSIRAPRSSAGRPGPQRSTTTSMQFQSAPRVLLRGDVVHLAQNSQEAGFNPRPAFFCGATNEGGYDTGTPTSVSIRAPRSSAGRRRSEKVRVPRQGFNPRPAFFCGATS